MITNWDEPHIRQKLTDTAEAIPAFETILGEIRKSPHRFQALPGEAGLDLIPENSVQDQPNRARAKLFKPEEKRNLLVLFFYKRSNIPFSATRFGYGAVTFSPERVTSEMIEQCLAFLTSGFHPEKRPAQLRRALKYSIPE